MGVGPKSFAVNDSLGWVAMQFRVGGRESAIRLRVEPVSKAAPILPGHFRQGPYLRLDRHHRCLRLCGPIQATGDLVSRLRPIQ